MAEISISRIICDFLVLATIAIPLLIFHEWVEPYKRGFYCDDETIRYPYKKSTVPRQLLIVIGILIPTLMILMTELFRTTHLEKRISSEFGTYQLRRHNVHRFIVRLYVFIGYFFVGVCFNQLMVDIAKYTIGRLRPHFMDVCRPSVGYDDCPLDHKYINESAFFCRGNDKYLIHESKLSFYSGHSAFSFYAAWYTTFYLQARLYRPLVSRLVIPVIQFALFAGATYVAYTRVSDYKHHWSDVLMGALMGSAIGIVNALFIAEVFSRREVPVKYHHKARFLAPNSGGGIPYRPSAEDSLFNNDGNASGGESASNSRGVPIVHQVHYHAQRQDPQKVVVHEERVASVMHPSYVELHTQQQQRSHHQNR